MSEAAPSPEQPEDLSIVSTRDLVIRLMRELEVRHQEDVFILFLKRPSDAGVPTILSRLVGDGYAVEGALGVMARFVRRANDGSAAPFKGEFSTSDVHEAGHMPGSVE